MSAAPLLRRPVFAATACVTLALGIGATTSVYSMVDAVLLAPLPYADPDRVVVIRTLDSNGDERPLAREAKERLGRVDGTFAAIAGYGSRSWILSDGADQPEEVTVVLLEHNALDVLGRTRHWARRFPRNIGRKAARDMWHC